MELKKYSYDNKAIWDKVKLDSIYLPQTENNTPDWQYMSKYMKFIESRVKNTINQILEAIGG